MPGAVRAEGRAPQLPARTCWRSQLQLAAPGRSQIEAPFKQQLCAFCFQREVHLLCACEMDTTQGTALFSVLFSFSQSGRDLLKKSNRCCGGRCSGLGFSAILLLWLGKGCVFSKSRLGLWPDHSEGIPSVGGQAGPPAPFGKPAPFVWS